MKIKQTAVVDGPKDVASAEGVRCLRGTVSLKRTRAIKYTIREQIMKAFQVADKLVMGPGTASRLRGIVMKVGQ